VQTSLPRLSAFADLILIRLTVEFKDDFNVAKAIKVANATLITVRLLSHYRNAV
jgi:hypothetical protein